MQLDAQQIFTALRRAGFAPDAAVTMTAIALAESEGRTDVLGDTRLVNQKWGPSFGLFQIRTLRAETGKGTPRDLQWLRQSVANQAAAAYAISAGGRDFGPWSAYTSGAYRAHLADAERAAHATGASFLPGIGGGGLSGLIAGLGDLALTGLFVTAGVVLVIVGAATQRRPRRG